MARGSTFSLNSGSDLYTGLLNALCGLSPTNLSMVDSVSANNVTLSGSGGTASWSTDGGGEDATIGRPALTCGGSNLVGSWGSTLTLGTTHTIAFWAKFDKTSGTIGIFGDYNANTPYWGAFGAKLYYYDSSGHYASVGYTPADTNWHHYCFVRTSSGANCTVAFYVDGSQVGTTQTITGYNTSESLSKFGNGSYLVAGTTSLYADFIIWTAALTGSQVARVAVMAAGTACAPAVSLPSACTPNAVLPVPALPPVPQACTPATVEVAKAAVVCGVAHKAACVLRRAVHAAARVCVAPLKLLKR